MYEKDGGHTGAAKKKSAQLLRPDLLSRDLLPLSSNSASPFAVSCGLLQVGNGTEVGERGLADAARTGVWTLRRLSTGLTTRNRP